MSLMAAYVGDSDRCLSALERAVRGGWFCAQTIAGEVWLSRMRDTPRFAALVAEAEGAASATRAAFRDAGVHRLLGL
jgi:hypothetical protein